MKLQTKSWPLAKQVGECIRHLRLELGMNQEQFAEKCGFFRTYLSRIETGCANPTLSALEVIANALDLSVFEFFELVNKHTGLR
ncbi:helix-turn-helix domain-containing protein [Methylotenera sp.]|uniref:helix-turn-helix domain-containing protein n=1 Tax=Methylotenera sp. TaxID=2051956 RepID=UPI0027250810|nr:helix-turn-helix transcriptional regulator [Methylotenera sp.]MDO9204150.1 helix-turn-helix transcriptional regulator [Methylotenera sp.]MDP3307848.1 helix-turn-helix transcriptional regulator [Methylotenera sp.]MDP3817880.1 helix-turn-helix transcriptional regulator [Methylotenera sp.]